MGDGRPFRLLAVTGGHRVDLDAFNTMLAAICGERSWVFAHAVQPAAQQWFGPEHRGRFDAILCHDLPGLMLQRGTAPRPVGPEPMVAERLHDLLEAGQGIVFLHHALAGWPGWPAWAEVLGGRYHYAPADLRGRCWPDSGFRYAEYTARVGRRRPPGVRRRRGLHPGRRAVLLPGLRGGCCPARCAPTHRSARFRETLHEVLGTPRTGPPWTHPRLAT